MAVGTVLVDLATEAGEALLTEQDDVLEVPIDWPGTAGGASSPAWGPRLRLYVWVALESGWPWTLGPHPFSRLDRGNVLSRAVNPDPPDPPPDTGDRLWQDVTCDVVELETTNGATETDGVFARAEAASVRVVLRDPHRQYDPLNPSSPWQYQGQSRLVAGVPVTVFAEVLAEDNTVRRFTRFSGTADTWDEPWTARPSQRRCTLVASDAVKNLVGLDRGEQPAEGGGDTVDQRLERTLDYYGWNGSRQLDASAVTLAPTTFAQSAWELCERATDDEIGFLNITPAGVLRFHNRATWATPGAPRFTIGCTPQDPSPWDIVVGAVVGPLNRIRNAIYATRVGGTMQVARSQPSIDRFGERSYKRTDLGHADDSQAGAWAAYVLALQAFPKGQLATVTVRPVLDPDSWLDVLGLELVTDRVRVLWTPPGSSDLYDTAPRVIGFSERIDRHRWELTWQLTMGDIVTRVWTLGPHPQDRLSDGNVLAQTTTSLLLAESGDGLSTDADDALAWL